MTHGPSFLTLRQKKLLPQAALLFCFSAFLYSGLVAAQDGRLLKLHASAGDAVVTLSHPDGSVSEHLTSGLPSLGLNGLASGRALGQSAVLSSSKGLQDGVYKYEVLSLPVELRTRTLEEFEANQYADNPEIAERVTGSFRVVNGQIVDDSLVEPAADQ